MKTSETMLMKTMEKLMHYKWFVSVMEGNQHNDNSKNNVDENIRNNIDENNENNGDVDAL